MKKGLIVESNRDVDCSDIYREAEENLLGSGGDESAPKPRRSPRESEEKDSAGTSETV